MRKVVVKHLLNEYVMSYIMHFHSATKTFNKWTYILSYFKYSMCIYLQKQLLNGPCGQIKYNNTLSLDMSDLFPKCSRKQVIQSSTLLSNRAWCPPALGSSCPARMLAPPTLTIRPLRGSMKGSASRTPPAGSTAPTQTHRAKLTHWRCSDLDRDSAAALTCHWI